MADTFNKKEREKKKRKRKQEKMERKEQRRHEEKSIEFMYVDENGNFTSTPPDPSTKTEINAEDIVLGIPKKEKLEDDPNREGTVKFFIQDKGYGFIEDSITGDSLFVHIENAYEGIQDKSKVSFTVGEGPKGKIALTVKPLVKKIEVKEPEAKETDAKDSETKDPEAKDSDAKESDTKDTDS